MAVMMKYHVHRATATPALTPDWDDPAWEQAETVELKYFRPESSTHRPHVQARLLYDARGVHGIFQVHDRYVRCVRANYFDEVYKDSCVEFFAQPKADSGYFNFEFNCGGVFLCSYIVDPERTPNGFKQFSRLPAGVGQTIQARSSLPRLVEPEITEPLIWTLRFFIPSTLFEHYVGPLGPLRGQLWRGNFYKCADETSHPHWACWSPVDQLNFHQPARFGTVEFV